MNDHELTFAQAASTAVLIRRFKEQYPDGDPHWHWCVNGCCVILHEPHMDEYAYFIIADGSVEKIDGYGNVIEEVNVSIEDL